MTWRKFLEEMKVSVVSMSFLKTLPMQMKNTIVIVLICFQQITGLFKLVYITVLGISYCQSLHGNNATDNSELVLILLTLWHLKKCSDVILPSNEIYWAYFFPVSFESLITTLEKLTRHWNSGDIYLKRVGESYSRENTGFNWPSKNFILRNGFPIIYIYTQLHVITNIEFG